MLNLKQTLESLQDIQGQPAVSVFVPTHRTFPDNQKDSIAIKNQLKTLEEQLLLNYEKSFVDDFLARIQSELDEVDPNYYLDTLAIFATPEQVDILRLPFNTKARTMVDTQFVLRDLIRELSYALEYYIVVVTRETGRLIHASNDTVIHEFSGEDTELNARLPHGNFPLKNETLYSENPADRSVAAQEDRYLKEFLNRVDKNLQVVLGQKLLPVVLVADRRNIGFYESIADRPQNIIFAVDNVTQLEDSEPRHIVESIQDQLKVYQEQQHQENAAKLDQFYGSERIMTDLQTVYQAALQGNAETLYVQQGYSVQGFVDPEQQQLDFSATADQDAPSVDVVNHIIKATQQHGGSVVFLPESFLKDKMPVVLLSRYAI